MQLPHCVCRRAGHPRERSRRCYCHNGRAGRAPASTPRRPSTMMKQCCCTHEELLGGAVSSVSKVGPSPHHPRGQPVFIRSAAPMLERGGIGRSSHDGGGRGVDDAGSERRPLPRWRDEEVRTVVRVSQPLSVAPSILTNEGGVAVSRHFGRVGRYAPWHELGAFPGLRSTQFGSLARSPILLWSSLSP